MSELPTTEELAARLEATEAKIDVLSVMQSLADQANDDYPEDWAEEEAFDPEPELVAELPQPKPTASGPSLPPVPRQQPNSNILDHQQLASQGIEIAAASLPDWPLYQDRVMAAVTAAPERLQVAFDTGDPHIVAGQLASAYQIAKVGDESRSLKLAAQTMSGAGGRPSPASTDELHWDAVKTAGRRGYWQQSD